MAQGIIVGNQAKFYWNIDANVGPGMPNKTEDVQLVQLAYACVATNPKETNAEFKAAAAKVKPGDAYNGANNDPLSVVIRMHQKLRGGTQDGVVSSIKSSSGVYAASTTWMLVPLNNHIFDVMGANWPRLSRHAQCPSALREASNRVLSVYG